MGMTERQYMDEAREFYFRLMVKPTIFLISLLVAGTIIDTMIGTNNAAKIIFAGVGGLGYLIQYYKETFSPKTK